MIVINGKGTAEVIVHVWLDVQKVLGVSRQPWMQKLRSAEWSRKRMAIFQKYTLRSLLNQTFKNFRIFLFLNPKYKRIHDQFEFPPQVERVYDFGESRYVEEIDTDYCLVMRIDSDDLFHKNMMKALVESCAFNPKRRTCRVYKKVIQWNLYHNFMSDFVLPISPFTAHVFPRFIYQDFPRLLKEQFMEYRTCKNQPKERLVCIVRHRENVTWTRINKNPHSRSYLNEEMRKRNNVVTDRNKMARILKDFGMPKETVIK